ncbi:hypothetical protein BH11BAC7_BH11BAC7_23600 [soil metagenome]
MRPTRRILFLLFSIFTIFPIVLTGQSSSCITADALGSDTICTAQCAVLFSNIQGTRQTNIYVSNSIPYTPYSFTGGNPVLVNLDDLWSPLVNIPFCFEFYGNTYNQLVIGTNGVITFDVSQANGNCPWTINVGAPNVGLPLNSIMAPFHDIIPTQQTAAGQTSINWQVYGTAPCRSFVVNWNDVAMFGNGCGALTSSSQVVLHESTNLIEIFIREKSVCAAWNNGAAIEGLQNASGTFATIYPGRNFPVNWSAVNDGVEFRPAGGPNYSIQWLDPANNVVGTMSSVQVCPAQTTTYTLQVTNTTCNGIPAVITDTVTVFVTPSNLTTTDSIVYPACSGSCNGSIDLFPVNGIPPYVFNWTPNVSSGPSASGLCVGTYVIEITDGSGCSNIIAVNLTPPPPFSLSSLATPSICNDSTGTALVSISGGTAPFTIYWSNGDTTLLLTGLPAGSYLVYVTDSSGCPDSLYVVIGQIGLSMGTTWTPQVCNGDCSTTATVTVLNGIPPYTYNWLPYGGSSPLADSLCSGLFSCIVSDSIGCQSTAVFQISSPSPVVITPASNQTICIGEGTTISALVTGGTAPYTYSWNNGLPPLSSNYITPTQTTIYTVIATDANGCTSVLQSTLVKVTNTPVPGFSSPEATCPPVMVNFTNLTDTAVTYFWNFGDPSSGANDTSTLFSLSHMYNNGGNYVVTLIAVNAYGCTDTIAIPNAVQVPPAAHAGITANASALSSLDPVVFLNNESANSVFYQLYFGDGDSLITTSNGPYTHAYDSLGTFTVMLIAWSANGCPDTAWLSITIEEPTSFFVPNAFTPNGDGKNDVFMPLGNNVKQLRLLIFNRWGELLFESNDMNQGWDGTFKGTKVQEDVYVWKVLYEDNLQGKHELIGRVSLIR